MKQVYSTTEVAVLCHVTPKTVVNWIDTGKLPCMKTGGGFRKVFREELIRFMKENNIPFEDGEIIKKILIVDDNPDDVNIMRQLLESSNTSYQIDFASDGEEGLFKIGVVHPALIILDIRMPKLDGFKVYELIKATEATADIKVLFVTGQEEDAFIDRLKEECIDFYLSKPLNQQLFIEKVDKILNS
jgi:excisionase family DNA binding protein